MGPNEIQELARCFFTHFSETLQEINLSESKLNDTKVFYLISGIVQGLYLANKTETNPLNTTFNSIQNQNQSNPLAFPPEKSKIAAIQAQEKENIQQQLKDFIAKFTNYKSTDRNRKLRFIDLGDNPKISENSLGLFYSYIIKTFYSSFKIF